MTVEVRPLGRGRSLGGGGPWAMRVSEAGERGGSLRGGGSPGRGRPRARRVSEAGQRGGSLGSLGRGGPGDPPCAARHGGTHPLRAPGPRRRHATVAVACWPLSTSSCSTSHCRGWLVRALSTFTPFFTLALREGGGKRDHVSVTWPFRPRPPPRDHADGAQPKAAAPGPRGRAREHSAHGLEPGRPPSSSEGGQTS